MRPRRRREGKGAIVRAIEAQGDRIVQAIRETAEAAQESRERVIVAGAELLRGALQEGARRAVVVDEGGRKVQFTGNDPGESGK